jgi:hypothetical protein
VSDYRLDDQSSIRDKGKVFSSSLYVQTISDAYAASCPMGTQGTFPRGKAQLGHDADHSPPTAKVKNE